MAYLEDPEDEVKPTKDERDQDGVWRHHIGWHNIPPFLWTVGAYGYTPLLTMSRFE